jgi:DNA repair exonuclease SbcCD ATPase subunit
VKKNRLRREGSVRDDQQKGMTEHEPYAIRCALAAGALLEGAELVEFQEHVKGCSECRSEYAALFSLVTRELQPAANSFRQRFAAIRTKPLPYARERFLRRARSEGVVFSREVETAPKLGSWYRGSIYAMAAVASLVVIAIGLTVFYLREMPDAARTRDAATAEQIAKLNRENGTLNASLSQLNESLAARQREIQRLRAQLENSVTVAENLRRNGEQARGAVERSSSRAAQLLDESRDQEKLLAKAKDEAARVGALRANDEASLVAEMVRVAELTDKLRIASATLDVERQLAATGQDVRELMAARQLHVIDVRDADANGEPGKAFGRVFLTEGKSLTFYAFDLDEDKITNNKRMFQVWGVPGASKNPARSLGFLKVDAKAPGRRVLKVENPELVKAINSVFVTAEPSTGGRQPSGQKLLYAYLGAPNHQ